MKSIKLLIAFLLSTAAYANVRLFRHMARTGLILGMSDLDDAQAALDGLTKNLADMDDLITQLFGVITADDARVAALQQRVADLIAQANIDAGAKATLAASAKAAFDKSTAEANRLREKVPGVPPVGGVPLLTSYASEAEFDSAVAAYKGPERVTKNGTDVKAGTDPSLDYYTHSLTGSVNTTGPTD